MYSCGIASPTERTVLKKIDHQKYDTNVIYSNDYESFILNKNNLAKRLSYLPCFPHSENDKTVSDVSHLLLVNVPQCCLSLRQWLQRFSEQLLYSRQTSDFDITNIHQQQYHSLTSHTFPPHFLYLCRRLKVNVALIVYNLFRLETFIHNEYMRLFPESRHGISSILDENDMAMVMIYYLQMDVDLFYMKISSTSPPQINMSAQDLFLNQHQKPMIHYILKQCQQINCLLCQPISLTLSMVKFDSYTKHYFVNRYQSILNGPANCQTKNIIYVLTCPCGNYEFIGSTSERVVDVILFYRKALNIFLHEYVTGVYRKSTKASDTKIFSSIGDQWLYKHAATCPAIWQIFFSYNPDHTCFIASCVSPQKPNYSNFLTLADHETFMFQSSNMISKFDETMSMNTNSFESEEQQRQKRLEFYQKWQLKQNLLLNTPDLYRFSLIATLPQSASSIVRTTIQSLFIVYTEAKLHDYL